MIPDEAVEAAAIAIHNVECSCENYEHHVQATLDFRSLAARAALTAAMPHIRARVAAEIRGSIDDMVFQAPGWRAGVNDAVAVVEAGMP